MPHFPQQEGERNVRPTTHLQKAIVEPILKDLKKKWGFCVSICNMNEQTQTSSEPGNI